MSFFDKAKQAAGQAAAKAKEVGEDAKQKIELSQSFTELGKTTFELIEAGEISNPQLDSTAAKIRELKAALAESDSPA